MTGDPLRHVAPGQPLQIQAATWNKLTDAARAVDGARAIFRPGPLLPLSSDDGNGNTGGGTGGGGCNCCDCTDCINLCAQQPKSVISSCESCGVAPRHFYLNLGPTLGTHRFSYVAGCIWNSANFDVNYTYPSGIIGSDTGTYIGSLTQNGADSTLAITYVSGIDVLKLGSGYRELSWKADPNRTWSCICNSKMIPAVSPERFPPNLYAPCEVCVEPVAETGGADDWTICHVDAGCVSSLTLPSVDDLTVDSPGAIPANWTAQISKSSPDSCCFTTLTNGNTDETCQTENGKCINVLMCDPASDPPIPCIGWWGSVCVGGTYGDYHLVVAFAIGQGSYPGDIVGNVRSEVLYRIAVADLVAGVNTLPLYSQIDYGGAHTWADHYDLTIDDCTFGASSYDYGYGCGYDYGGSGGGGGDPPGCSGSCVFEWSGSAWSVVEAMSNCVGDGCSCHEPGIDGSYEGQLTSGSCST